MELLAGIAPIVIVILIGSLFLFWGEKLFWLFTALTGFACGALLAAVFAFQLLPGTFPAGPIIMGLLTMGVFAALSLKWRRPMTMITALFAGGAILVLHSLVFLTGGLFIALFAGFLGGGGDYILNGALILFLVGGIASAALAWVSPIWARIVVSSLFGMLIIATSALFLFYGIADQVLQDLPAWAGSPMVYLVLLLLTIPLALLGAIFQQRRMHKRPAVSPYALSEPIDP